MLNLIVILLGLIVAIAMAVYRITDED